MKTFNISTWHRKSSFEFFKDFEDPFFNITAQVDVTNLYHKCKAEGSSFFLASLHASNWAANQLEGFKLRLQDDQVVYFDHIDLGSTVLFEDNSFGFCYFKYIDDWNIFSSQSQKRLDDFRAQKSFDPALNQKDLIHYSVIPWVAFTSFKHARKKRKDDSIPKIVFGKRFQQGERHILPVSVEVHHALMDGFDVGQYFQLFEEKAG